MRYSTAAIGKAAGDDGACVGVIVDMDMALLLWSQGSINAADPPQFSHRHAHARLAHDPDARPQIRILVEPFGSRNAPVDHAVSERIEHHGKDASDLMNGNTGPRLLISLWSAVSGQEIVPHLKGIGS